MSYCRACTSRLSQGSRPAVQEELVGGDDPDAPAIDRALPSLSLVPYGAARSWSRRRTFASYTEVGIRPASSAFRNWRRRGSTASYTRASARSCASLVSRPSASDCARRSTRSRTSGGISGEAGGGFARGVSITGSGGGVTASEGAGGGGGPGGGGGRPDRAP